MSTRSLTQRQQIFLQHYHESGNAVQSAIKAGYTPKTAQHMSYKFLQNPLIRTEIEKKRIDPEFMKNVKDENVRTLIFIKTYEEQKLKELLTDPNAKQSDIDYRSERVRKAVMDLARITGQEKEAVTIYNSNSNSNTQNSIQFETVSDMVKKAEQMRKDHEEKTGTCWMCHQPLNRARNKLDF